MAFYAFSCLLKYMSPWPENNLVLMCFPQKYFKTHKILCNFILGMEEKEKEIFPRWNKYMNLRKVAKWEFVRDTRQGGSGDSGTKKQLIDLVARHEKSSEESQFYKAI